MQWQKIQNFEELQFEEDARPLMQLAVAMKSHFILKEKGISSICNLPAANKQRILNDFDNSIATIQYLRKKLNAFQKVINEKGTSMPMEIELPDPPQDLGPASIARALFLVMGCVLLFCDSIFWAFVCFIVVWVSAPAKKKSN